MHATDDQLDRASKATADAMRRLLDAGVDRYALALAFVGYGLEEMRKVGAPLGLERALRAAAAALTDDELPTRREDIN